MTNIFVNVIDPEFVDIIELMPHGSGFVTDWTADIQGNQFVLSSGFHAMDENGYYCGWIHFDIYLNRFQNSRDWYTEFTIEFQNDTDLEDFEYEMLTEYIEEMIRDSLYKVVAFSKVED